MMEGPSLVIACEEFRPFVRQKIFGARGTAALPFARIKDRRLVDVQSWGKHFLLIFNDFTLRIHFLMFGSYRINDPRANRDPKLELKYKTDVLYFYSCAIKLIEGKPKAILAKYDWSIDIMNKRWSAQKALVKEARAYSLKFYRWKKIFELKKHWQIFRKRRCPDCDRAVIKKPTGKLARLSHFCRHCQPKVKATALNNL